MAIAFFRLISSNEEDNCGANKTSFVVRDKGCKLVFILKSFGFLLAIIALPENGTSASRAKEFILKHIQINLFLSIRKYYISP
ncbi:MAG: hypothetical protein CFE24_11490 [Flavobacterium sp. BFFFF2]|nr:MAG: hypothetical protein CFE24_11490 [Flavobacterium sp. BFFFF2]